MELAEEVAVIFDCAVEELNWDAWTLAITTSRGTAPAKQQLQGIAYNDFQVAIGQRTAGSMRRKQFKYLFILVERRMMEALTYPNPWIQEWAKLVHEYVQKNGPIGDWIWRQDIYGDNNG